LRPRFHLAFPVRDLSEARTFCGGLLGCPEEHPSAEWIDFDFYGHQTVAHLSPNESEHKAHNKVDGEDVPVRHFGIILTMDGWNLLEEELNRAHVDFVIAPVVRFKGQVGEQATFFIKDPSGNALEFKAFQNDTRIFAR
jgi:uncharacterized protein